MQETVFYEHEQWPIRVGIGHLSTFPNYSAGCHYHRDIEIIYIIQGQMQYNINGTVLNLQEKESVIIMPGQFHYGFSRSLKECVFMCTRFRLDTLCFPERIKKEELYDFFCTETEYIYLNHTAPWHSEALAHIARLTKDKSSLLYMQGHLCLVWDCILSHLQPSPTPKIPKNHTTCINDMISFIHRNFNRKITLSDIAKEGHVSKRTCATLFARYHNKTPIEFLNDYRLRQSIQYMSNHDMSILEIAISCGFSSASYYTELFGRTFRMTPSAYRKIHAR